MFRYAFDEAVTLLGTNNICLVKKWGKTFEQAHDKTYNKTFATIKDSDQTAHSRSLIKVFADRMCLLQPPGYPTRSKREPVLYWVDVLVDFTLV